MGKWLNAYKEKKSPQIPSIGTDVGDVGPSLGGGTAPARPFNRGTANASHPKTPTILSGQTCRVVGNVIPLHRMRPACQAAGHCLGLTGEHSCNLYPVRLGWCRERT